MTWAAWFLMFYLGVAAWTATAVILFQGTAARGRPIRAGLLAVLVMWTVPAVLAGTIVKGGWKE